MNQKLAEFLDFLMSFRNLLVWVVLLVVSIVFRHTGSLTGEQFVNIMKTVTVTLFGVHGIEHYTTMVKTNLNTSLNTQLKLASLSKPEVTKND